MRALVTGGCGFIGSNLVHKLVENGWTVDVVDDLSNGDVGLFSNLSIRTITSFLVDGYDRENDPRKPDVVIIVDDFVCEGVVSNIINQKYDYVFHMAAMPRVEYSVQNPVQTNEANSSKTLKLMTHCLGNVKRFIFSSSSSVYGDAQTLPTPENEEKNPESPYALQKLHIEQYAKLYNKLYDLDIVSLRYFNVYGPGQYGDSPYSTAVAAWCDKINSKKPLRSDGDGTQSRDLVYVDDVVDANIAAALREEKFNGECYNIGSGLAFPNNFILGIFCEKFPEAEIVSAPRRAGDVMNTLGDISAAKKAFGYNPQTSLMVGLKKTWKWWGFYDEK